MNIHNNYEMKTHNIRFYLEENTIVLSFSQKVIKYFFIKKWIFI